MMVDCLTPDYSSACRLCLSKEGKYLPIFGVIDEDLGALSARIQACLALEVSQTDELPKQICRRCECHVNAWHYFKLECESTQQKLRKWQDTSVTHVRGVVENQVIDTGDGQMEEVDCQVASVKTEPGEEMIDITECAEELDHPIHTPDRTVARLGLSEPTEQSLLQHGRIQLRESPGTELSDLHEVFGGDQTAVRQDMMGFVIAETTSVGLEPNVINSNGHLPAPLDVLDAEDEDLVRLAVQDVNDVEDDDEDLDVDVIGLKDEENNVTFIKEGTPSRRVMEVTLEDSNHRDFPSMATETVNVDMDVSGEGEVNEGADDPLGSLYHVKKEVDADPLSCWYGSMKIKQELEDLENVENLGGFVRKFTPFPGTSSTLSSPLPATTSPVKGSFSQSSPASVSGRKFPCHKCKDTFSSQVELSLHEKNHLENNESLGSNKSDHTDTQSVSCVKDTDSKCCFQGISLPKVSNELYDEEHCFCKVCEKALKKKYFWRHMKTHLKENPFKCNVCKKVFPGRRELVIHRVRTVSKYCRQGAEPDVDLSFIISCDDVPRGKMGRYKCRECDDEFGQLSFAKAHIRVHTGEKPFFCYKCNTKEFRLRKTAIQHVSVCKGHLKGPSILLKGKVKLPGDSITKAALVQCKTEKPEKSCEGKRLKCRKCRKVFATPVGLSNHLRTGCAGLSPCPSCSKMFSGFTLKKHIKLCRMKGVSSYSNAVTGTNLASAVKSTSLSVVGEISRKNTKITKILNVSVKELEKMHLDREGKMHMTCKLCDRTLGSRKSMQAHLLKHSAKAFRCPVCRLLMRHRSTYEAHLATYHDENTKEKEKLESCSSESILNVDDLKQQEKKSKLANFSSLKLKCELCLRQCGSAAALKYHKLSHKKVRCKVCEITFPATMEKAHICTPKNKMGEQDPQLQPDSMEHHGERKVVQYTCHLCKKRFHTRKMLYQHKKMHIKMKIYKCKMCGNSYSDAGALLLHKQSEHSSEMVSIENVVPVLVGKSASGVSEVKKEVKEWKCSKCPRTYSSEDLLNRHLKLHTSRPKTNMLRLSSSVEKALYCSLCDRVFSSEKSFNTHRGWHSRIAAEARKAPSAYSSPQSSSDAFNVVAESPSANVPTKCELSGGSFVCEICHKKFNTLKNLRCHVVHHKKGTLLEKSKATFKSNLAPVVTLHNVLSQEKFEHKCKFCPKLFLELSSYKNHIKVHTAENSLQENMPNTSTDTVGENSERETLKCKLCNKEYKSRKGLKHHILGHSGQKPFKCKSCSNQYSTTKALNRHETEMHASALRPFSCNRCKASFILKEDLLAHYEKCSH